MALPGESITITVEPIEVPTTAPVEQPAPIKEPVPA
jgi:hypothetical protein